MKAERNFGECFKYSLHDVEIQRIEYVEGNLILYPKYIFSYDDKGKESIHNARIIFENVDEDFVHFLVFDDTIKEKFSGKYIELAEYQQKYKDSEFEIIVETYNLGRAVFQGWLRTNDKPVDCIMNIYFTGKMVYDIED